MAEIAHDAAMPAAGSLQSRHHGIEHLNEALKFTDIRMDRNTLAGHLTGYPPCLGRDGVDRRHGRGGQPPRSDRRGEGAQQDDSRQLEPQGLERGGDNWIAQYGELADLLTHRVITPDSQRQKADEHRQGKADGERPLQAEEAWWRGHQSRAGGSASRWICSSRSANRNGLVT